jgi:hypothetical protein
MSVFDLICFFIILISTDFAENASFYKNENRNIACSSLFVLFPRNRSYLSNQTCIGRSLCKIFLILLAK